jgi:DHA1 family multidrug resistance protein-like MFS transporter
MHDTERSWVRTVAIIWLAELIAIMGMSLVIPFLPLYLAELHVPADQVRLWAGWVGGANFLCAAVLAPFWGNLADRFGRKPMAIRALVGLAVTVGLMGLVHNVYQLFALRMLQGAFGGFVAAAIALAGTTVPRERLGSALGFLQSAVVGGNLIGPLIGGELSHWFGYRSTFFITGGALFVAMLLILFLVKERHVPPEANEQRTVRSGLRELWALPELRWMAVLVMLTQSGLMLINPQISLFVKDLVRDPAEVNRMVGLVIAAPAVTSFLSAPFWGRAGDNRGHALVLATALIGCAVVSPWAALATAAWHLLCVRLLMGAFTAAVNPSAHSAVAHSVEESRTAAAFAMLSSAQMLGACLGPFASGPIASAWGVRPLFPVTGLLLLAGGLIALRVRGLHAQRALREPRLASHR